MKECRDVLQRLIGVIALAVIIVLIYLSSFEIPNNEVRRFERVRNGRDGVLKVFTLTASPAFQI